MYFPSNDVIYVVEVVAGLTNCEENKDFWSIYYFLKFVFFLFHERLGQNRPRVLINGSDRLEPLLWFRGEIPE
jgi:hypothetical protein